MATEWKYSWLAILVHISHPEKISLYDVLLWDCLKILHTPATFHRENDKKGTDSLVDLEVADFQTNPKGSLWCLIL
jgi:hypothetical protein